MRRTGSLEECWIGILLGKNHPIIGMCLVTVATAGESLGPPKSPKKLDVSCHHGGEEPAFWGASCDSPRPGPVPTDEGRPGREQHE